MTEAACAVCGAPPGEPVLRAREPNGLAETEFALRRCSRCDHLFVSPRPEGAELAGFYPSGYYGGGALEAAFSARKAARAAAGLPTGRVLDVGCGDGGFLASMRALGWECWGVEISPEGRERAAARPGLTILGRPLEDCGLPAARFDLVTLWHSIEHMERPDAVLREARRVLKDDGALFIAFPSGASWELAVFGSRWFHLDLPRHLHFFSPAGLSRLLGDCGFRVERVSGWSFDYNAFGFVQSALNAAAGGMNLLYRRMKRLPAPPRSWREVAALAAVAPAAALAAAPWAGLAAACGRAGCVELRARPNS